MSFDDLADRFAEALDQLGNDPQSPLPGRNPEAFALLAAQLEVGASAGHPRCQAALATILGFGLSCRSEAEFIAQRHGLLERATSLWAEAASQGFWPAFDNLVTCGVGPEANAARAAVSAVEAELPELIGRQGALPVYGPEFMQHACARYRDARGLTRRCS